jgi:capsular polysaccharide biosynthesis protein
MYCVIKCVKTKRVLKGKFASSTFHSCNAKTQMTQICVTGPQRVKQQSKCNTDKVCNCLITFLLTVVLSIEGHVFLVEYVFQEGNRNTNVVQEQFAEEFPETPVSHHSAFRRLIGKFRVTG